MGELVEIGPTHPHVHRTPRTNVRTIILQADSDSMELRTKIETVDLNLFYGIFQALKNVNIHIPDRSITAIIGPSGCGKSTLLRCFNRMNDLVENFRMEGKILIDGQNILDPATDLIALRRNVGMVFQRPNVFDLSIYNNLKFGLRIHRVVEGRSDMRDLIRHGLEQVGLWEELKDKLGTNARMLSLEQRQRLCIARVLILKPRGDPVRRTLLGPGPHRDAACRGPASRIEAGIRDRDRDT